LRDIQTNDGNPSGVFLPDDAYGVIVLTGGDPQDDNNSQGIIGNQRILDNNGYEYRTNLLGVEGEALEGDDKVFTFNFNTKGGVTFSDVVGVTIGDTGEIEVQLADIVNTFALWDIDILNLNEVIFSCRVVVFACTDQDNPLLEALLERIANSSAQFDPSVASFEYGINNAIPHSKGGELLCPGNNISEGIVQLSKGDGNVPTGGPMPFILFIGLNNGNGRGSMDAIWQNSTFLTDFFPDQG